MELSALEAAAILEEGQGEVDRLTAGVPDDEAVRRHAIGGGEWSLKDLIGHLAPWEELALETISRTRADGSITRIALDDVDAENARDIARKAEWPIATVRKGAAATHEQLVADLREMADDEWRTPRPVAGGGERTLGDMLGSVLGAPGRPFGHAWAHLQELKDYVSSLP